MIRIALCDDSSLQLELTQSVLLDYLKGREEVFAVDSFLSGEELIHSIQNGNGYDIYILDLIMPGMNGMEAASALRSMKDNGKIIFLTSSSVYAVQSYDVEASAYILKPLEPGKFNSTLDKVLSTIEKQEDKVIIDSSRDSVAVDVSDICYVTIECRKLKYILKDGRVLTSHTIRKRFQDEVSDLAKREFFFSCGLTLLINLQQVDALSDESILLKNGEILFPSRSCIKSFEQAWRKFSLR